MVRRTRACQACHSRRIRCDETLPHCNQCLRAGRQCPGPISGALIVDVTSQTRARARSRPFLSLQHPGAQNAPAALISPSQVPVITQSFFSQFLDYFASRSTGSPGRFWLHELPSVSGDGARSGLELAVQATSTIFYAESTPNESYCSGSRAIYGEALERHCRSVATLRTASRAPPAAQVLCTTLLLGFYEAISSTQAGGEGYMRHVEGAAKIVEVLGPDWCADGLVNELFFTTRTQMLLISFLTRKQSIYATPQHLRTPYPSDMKPIHERLMDILTLMTEELNFPSHNQIEHATRGPGFIDNVESGLRDLWIEFRTCYLPPSLSEPEIGEVIFASISTATALNIAYPTTSTEYPNAFTAYIVSYFSLARIMLQVIITNIDRSQIRNPERDTAIRHQASASILSCAAYLETQNLGCGYIRVVFPLLIVGRYGSVDDGRAARAILERWRDRGVVRGLVELVVGRWLD